MDIARFNAEWLQAWSDKDTELLLMVNTAIWCR
jgi:hypothetical protein